MIALSDLVGRTVRDADGAVLGRVREIHVYQGQVRSLVCDRADLRGRKRHRIPWRRVADVGPTEIRLAPKS